MSTAPNQPTARLLPSPKQVRRTDGICRAATDIRLDIQCADARIERAAGRWRDELPPCDGPPSGIPAKTSVFRARIDKDAVGKTGSPGGIRNGYRLTIRPGEIDLVAGSAAGCFHGLQTLAQLRSGDDTFVPCCTIADWPDYPTRGLLHDVTRGKVATLATLKHLADRLAQLKANQLQLYIEYAFVFSFDEEICDASEGLTPDEIRELGAYCHERFIELVPAVASPGHMGRILSMPRYRHLAELESEKPWSDTSWPKRARGLTLDCRNPESHQLVENIWSDVMDAFDGEVANICGDEPWDLGKRQDCENIDKTVANDAYVEHLRRVYEQCAARGRHVQVCSDVLSDHFQMLTPLPKDLTILHWGYDDETDYDATGRFVEAGFQTFACPGTSGWKRIINAIGLAERNITTFARRGLECGATGLINTDWGDHGHFNLLGCSWHAIALGAVCGWDARCTGGVDFDARMSRQLWGLDAAAALGCLRKASRWADTCETWRLLWMPLASVRDDATLPTTEAAKEASHFAENFLEQTKEIAHVDQQTRRDFDELRSACRFTQLLAGKIAIAHGANLAGWPGQLMNEVEAYRTLWNRRNKPSGLGDIVAALQAVADDVRSDGT